MNAFFGDLKAAVRALIARPAFSALVIGVLGCGLACVIFTLALLNGFFLRPLPFPAPEQLLQAGIYADEGGDFLGPASANDLLGVRRQVGDLAQVGGFTRSMVNLSDIELPERDFAAFVSANLFGLLGVAPILGRDFVSDDERDGAPAVAMLTYALWQSRYGGDRAIVGRQIRINAQPATVIGVMPEDFSFPAKEVIWIAAHLVEGMKTDNAAERLTRRDYWIVVRRRAEATNAAIATAVDTWFAQAVHADPERFRGKQAGIGSLENINWSGYLRKPLYIMLTAVFMLLLVACANAGNLMLARMFGRRQEIAVRVALGATRKRLVMHALMESLLLSLAATLLAVLAANVGLSWFSAWVRTGDLGPAPWYGPARWLRFDIDATVLLFVSGAALATALITGLPAAWSASNEAIANNLHEGARGVAGGSITRIGRSLVIGEIALSCALLISVGTLVRGIVSIDRTDIGIDTRRLLYANIVLSPSAYPTAVAQLRLLDRLADRYRAESGVAEATVATAVPGTDWNESREVLPAGALPGDGPIPGVQFGAVDDHFLATYGIALQEGRFFDARDTADGVRVAVVDRRFVERMSAGAPVLGRQFRLDPRKPEGATVTVVGVIGTLALREPTEAPQPSMLIPLHQGPFHGVASISVRTHEGSTAFAPHLNKLMGEIDADTPLSFRDYSAFVKRQTKAVRIVAGWFEVLGTVALMLAGAGLYGVVAVSISRRTREIGVRRALGAPNRQILRDVFTRSMVQLVIGLAIGLAVGIPFARLLDNSLIATGYSSDPIVALSVVLVMILATVLAIIVPARRALRVDPITALRSE